MRCNICDADNLAENNYCGKCGTPLGVRLEKRHSVAVEQLRERLKQNSPGTDMEIRYQGCGISLRGSKGRGRGVFSEKHFSRGEIIEKCPVLMIPRSQLDHIYETVLGDYVYPWGENDEGAILPQGLGLFYNHSYAPNADWVQDMNELTQCFVALRDIDPGEEITVNYNGPPDDPSPMWFQMAE